MDSIVDLEKTVEKLRENDEIANSMLKRIYRIDSRFGTQIIPNSFKKKTLTYFGHRDPRGNITESENDVVKRIENQKIISVYNKWTGEGSLFNSLRAMRPGIRGADLEEEKKYVSELIEKSKENCDFCHPEKYTPEDIFGRIHGKYSITAANIAKYDSWSSLILFNDHNPIEFSFEEFSDYLDTGFAWFQSVYNHEAQYRFPFFVWNCLYRAGASQVHGHCQVLMSEEPYAKLENIRKSCKLYKTETGADLLQDIYQVHDSLGLSVNHNDVGFFASITPLKEKEVVIISSKNPSHSNNVKMTLFKIMRCFIDVMGVYSFNLSISCPPMDNEDEYPYILKIVDRGSLRKPTSDMGGMELYGSSVVADDPYKVIKILKNAFSEE